MKHVVRRIKSAFISVNLTAGIHKDGVIMTIAILGRTKTGIRLMKNHAVDGKKMVRHISCITRREASPVGCMNDIKAKP